MSALSQQPPTTELSRVRNFLFVALAIVWFSEMNFLGFQALSRIWAHLWQVTLPQDPQLATALFETWSIGAPAKGALLVMAIFGLRSRQPATRNALYVSMALVPPLNIAFPFRYQGFLPGPVTVATTLSIILWGSFILIRERTSPAERLQASRSRSRPASGWETFQFLWFAVTSAMITLFAILLLFQPVFILRLALPGHAGLFNPDNSQLSSLIHVSMACGTHFLAVSTACWLATVNCRRHPALARAVAVTITVCAALFAVFPLRQIVQDMGLTRATPSILLVSVPLFFGWLLYLVIDAKRRLFPAGLPAGG